MNFLYVIICYLLGSIPSALIIGKLFRNTDIREHGSGNLGATNAIRVLGKKLGLIVAVMDVLKGGTAVLLATHVFTSDIDPIIFGLFAVVGHVYPLFANFRGGKAVATSGGIILFYNPFIFLLGLITFAISLKISKYVSLSSTMTAIMLLVVTTLFTFTPSIIAIYDQTYGKFNVQFFFVILFLALFIIYRHIPNYKRLMAGTERKIGQNKQ